MGVNRQLLTEKGETVLRCLQRIRDKKPKTLNDLLSDVDAQDIIALNLERSIQACVDIASHIIAYTPLPASPTMADAFLSLAKANIVSQPLAERMVKAVGLRNILVHQYRTLDWVIVWTVIDQDLGDPVSFVQTVRNWKEGPT